MLMALTCLAGTARKLAWSLFLVRKARLQLEVWPQAGMGASAGQNRKVLT